MSDDKHSNTLSKARHFKQHIRDFSGYTTLHGLHFVFGSSQIVRRVVWLVLILTGLGFCVNQLIVSFYKLNAHDDVISKKIVPSSKLAFPAVTICNTNMMKKSLIENTDAQLFIDKLNIFKYSEELDKTTLNSSFDIQNAVTKYGHAAEDLIIACTWNGKACSHLNFTTKFSYLYGLCHTFNSGQQGYPLLSSTSTERRYGLALTLNAERDDYYGMSSYFNTGIRMAVHHQNEEPMVEVDGIDVMAGFMTDVHLQRTQYVSLGPPYKSACGERQLKTSRVYTRSRCLMECNTRKVIKQCGCRLLGMPNLKESSFSKHCNPEEMMACGVYANESMITTTIVNGATLLEMLRNVLSTLTYGYQVSLNALQCDCPRTCKEVKYTTQINVADFIGDMFANDAAESYAHRWSKANKKSINHPMAVEAQESISKMLKMEKKQLLHLSIHYHELKTYVTTERPFYDINDFGADVGGYIGLFLGCSVLTVFEFIDFVLVCCLGRKNAYSLNQEITQRHDNKAYVEEKDPKL